MQQTHQKFRQTGQIKNVVALFADFSLFFLPQPFFSVCEPKEMEVDAPTGTSSPTPQDGTNSAMEEEGQRQDGKVPPLALVPNNEGGMGLTRHPESVSEFAWLFQQLYSDWAERIQSDPTWLQYLSKRNETEKKKDNNSFLRATQALFQPGCETAESLALFRKFYDFLLQHHDNLMTVSCLFHTQTMMFQGSNTHTTKLRQDGMLRPLPVGIGSCGLAFMLLSTENYPNRWFVAYANLLGPIVSVEQLQTELGPSNLTEDVVRERRTQQFCVDDKFVLNSATPIASDVIGSTVSVLYAHTNSLGEMSGQLNIAVYTPGVGFVELKVEGSSVSAHGKSLVSAFMSYIAIALPESDSGKRKKLLIYRADVPSHPATIVRAAVKEQDDGGQSDPTGITSVRFDHTDSGRIWVAYDDGTLSTWMLPSADEIHSPIEWPTVVGNHARETMATRRIAMTSEQALQQAEVSKALAQIDLKQPVERIIPEMGLRGRVVTISPQNVWAFTQDARTNGAETPSISQVAATTGEQIGTMPVLHYPGFTPAVSVSTAGNLMVVHYATQNAVQFVSLRDNKVLWYQKLSEYLAALYGQKSVHEMQDSHTSPLTGEVDKYAPKTAYQSTWAALGRVAVLLPNGAITIADGMQVPLADQPVADATSL